MCGRIDGDNLRFYQRNREMGWEPVKLKINLCSDIAVKIGEYLRTSHQTLYTLETSELLYESASK